MISSNNIVDGNATTMYCYYSHAPKGVANAAVTMFNRVAMLTEKIQTSLVINLVTSSCLHPA